MPRSEGIRDSVEGAVLEELLAVVVTREAEKSIRDKGISTSASPSELRFPRLPIFAQHLGEVLLR
jgi:hypothetical protein